jgi:hypothetical protein
MACFAWMVYISLFDQGMQNKLLRIASLAQNSEGYPVGTTVRKSGLSLPAEGSIDVHTSISTLQEIPQFFGGSEISHMHSRRRLVHFENI